MRSTPLLLILPWCIFSMNEYHIFNIRDDINISLLLHFIKILISFASLFKVDNGKESSTNTKPSEDNKQTIVVSCSLGSVILLLIVTVGVVLIRRRNKRNFENEIIHNTIPLDSLQSSQPLHSFEGKLDHKMAEKHIYSNVSKQSNDNLGYSPTTELSGELNKLRKFSGEDMIYIEDLGEGAFGKVLLDLRNRAGIFFSPSGKLNLLYVQENVCTKRHELYNCEIRHT